MKKKKFLIYLPRGTVTSLKKLLTDYSYSSLKLHGLIRDENRKVKNIMTGKTKIVELYSVRVGHDLVIDVNADDKIQYLGFRKWRLIR